MKKSHKRASCPNKMLIFAMSGGRNRRLQKESVSAFVPRNEIAKITTGGTEGHDAHPFLRMHLRLEQPYPHIKTAWEHCFRSLSGKAFGDACFLVSGAVKSSRLFLYY